MAKATGVGAEYEVAIRNVIKALEGIAKVKAPATQYLDALEHAKEEIELWIDASIHLARQDVKRQAGE